MRQLKKSLKRKYWQQVGGRKGLSELVIQEVRRFMKNPTYKEAAKLAGKMRLLAELCESDDYWEEKMLDGYYWMLEKLEYEGGVR